MVWAGIPTVILIRPTNRLIWTDNPAHGYFVGSS